MATVAPDPLQTLAGQSEPDGLYEVIDGRIVEKSMGAYEYWLAGVIFGVLDRYAEAHPIGRALIEMVFDFRPHIERERRPDVAFVPFERWASDRRVPRARAWAVIPDLAVEIVSLTNSADEVAEKLEEYFQVGVRQVWVVYPRQAKIYVYHSTTAVQVLAPGDELEVGAVLPGFRLSVKDIFNKAGEPA
jgi:Uma2 family endonuclease